MSEADRWLGVELRHLAALRAVAEKGSFGAAADSLGYTQSAVSQQIATLERAVGVKLVERPGGPRRVSLTEAGEVLLGHAQSIMARLNAAQADLADLSDGAAGRLRVGTYQSVGTRILPLVMREFHRQWPKVELTLRESNDDEELLTMVEQGELDIAFTVLPVPDGPFEAVELMRDPYVLLAVPGSELATQARPPTLRDLQGVALIAGRTCRAMAQLETVLSTRGVEPCVVFRSDDNGTIHGMVSAGVGCALMPRLAVDEADPGVVVRELGGRGHIRLIAVAWHQDRYHSAAARGFVETARAVCGELAEEPPETLVA